MRQANRVVIGGNTIHRFAHAAVPAAQLTRLLGIQVTVCGSIQVVGNEIIDIGPTFISVAASMSIAGIAVEPTFHRLDVVDNVVRRSELLLSVGDQAVWTALAVLGTMPTDPNQPPSPGVGGGSFHAAGNLVFELTDDRVIQIARGPEIVAIRGNLLEGHGGPLATSAYVQAGGVVVFDDNRCVVRSDATPDGSLGTASRISPGALVADNNYFDVPRNWAAMRVLGPSDLRFSILGNVGDGDILIGFEPLGPPWRPLNNIAPG